jgi:hypothetical protein
VIEDATTYRSKDQVLYDLSKALHFSPESLEANRQGRLSSEQAKYFAGRVIRPAGLMVICAAAPFLLSTSITAQKQGLSLAAAFPALLRQLIHVSDLFEADGKTLGAVVLASILICLGIAVYFAARVPWSLYLDLLDRKILATEGRVVAREDQVLRSSGRDPIERYFFSLRHLNFDVNLAAFRALENGSIYLVYLLPRSETLVSIEPKVGGGAAVLTSGQNSSQA